MPSEVVYLPLRGASRDARTTKANMQWPAMVALDNFHSSTSTETPTVREAITGKAVLPHITLASGAKNWLNTIVPQANLSTESFLTRLHQAAYSDTVANSLRCTCETIAVTIAADSTYVSVMSGGGVLGVIYPGDFIKFSGDDTYYDVTEVLSDSAFKVASAPGEKTSESCTVYHTHCPYRAQWPLQYNKYGDIHIYHACDPTGSSPQAYMRPPFRKSSNAEYDTIITTTTEGVPTTYSTYTLTGHGFTTPPKIHNFWRTDGANIYAITIDWNLRRGAKTNNGGITFPIDYTPWLNADPPDRGGADRISPYWRSSDSMFFSGVGKRQIRYGQGGGLIFEFKWNSYGGLAGTTNAGRASCSTYYGGTSIREYNSYQITHIFSDGTDVCAIGTGFDTSNKKVSICAHGPCVLPFLRPESPTFALTESTVSGTGLWDAVWDGSLAIAVGENGSIQTSADLDSWTERNGGDKTYTLYSVANNSTTKYAAVGSGGTALFSADASSWSAATSDTTNSLRDIIYANSLYVAVGDAGTIITSSDAETYTAQTSGTTANLSSVAWDGTYFIVGSSDTNIILRSTDGVTWGDTVGLAPGPPTGIIMEGQNDPTIAPTHPIVSMNQAGAVAYWAGTGSGFGYSEWPDLSSQADANDVAYHAGLYVAVGDSGEIATSTDGVAWTRQASGVASDLLGVCYDATNAKWIAVGAMALLTSADAITWLDDSAVIPATLTDTEFRRVRYISDTTTVVAVGYDATANRSVTMYSTDATGWTHALMANQDSDQFYDVSYNTTTSEYMWCGIGTNGGAGALWRNATLEYTNADIASNANFDVTDITGMDFTNSTWGRLYARWTDSTTTLDWYSDAARTTLVATGTGAPGTTITMVESGGSGLSGSVDVDAGQTGDLDFTIHVECTAVPLSGVTSTALRALWYDTNRIVWAGVGSAACGYCGVDYSGPTALSLPSCTCVTGTPGSSTYWFGDNTNPIVYQVNIGNQVTTTDVDIVYWYPLLNSGVNSFMILDGYVVVMGTRELSGGAFTYYPRRIRWTVPGTYSDFSGFGSGTQDIPGFGDFLAGEVVEHTGVIFEKGGIGALNWTGETDPTAGPIWTYRQIARGLTTISNPVVHEGAIWFVGNTGLLYRTNGIEAVPTGGEFDLSKFTEFPPTTPVQMVFVPATRQLAVLVQSSGEVTSPSVTYVDNKVYMVNIDSGKTTTWTVSAPGQRLSLVQVIGADSPTWPA